MRPVTFGHLIDYDLAMTRLMLVVICCLALAGPAWAGLDEATAAYNRGDYETALRELRPLAEQGLAEAQFNLGFMYGNGKGVPQDYADALKWYRLAAEQGLASAQTNLGLMYSKGRGVPQDYVQAHMWYNLAAAQGNETGTKNRDIVAARMTPADVSIAQRPAGRGSCSLPARKTGPTSRRSWMTPA